MQTGPHGQPFARFADKPADISDWTWSATLGRVETGLSQMEGPTKTQATARVCPGQQGPSVWKGQDVQAPQTGQGQRQRPSRDPQGLAATNGHAKHPAAESGKQHCCRHLRRGWVARRPAREHWRCGIITLLFGRTCSILPSHQCQVNSCTSASCEAHRSLRAAPKACEGQTSVSRWMGGIFADFDRYCRAASFQNVHRRRML